MENKRYKKRLDQRRLASFQEYTNTTFAAGVSFVFAFLIVVFGYDFNLGEINPAILGYGILWLVSGVLLSFIRWKMTIEILQANEVKRSTRRLGFLLIPFVFTGNFFMAIAGFSLVKKEKTIEYTLATYAILTSVTIMVISSLNLFKEYVANQFMLGMGLLGILTLFYVLTMVMISKYVTKKTMDPKMFILAIPLLLSILIGNVFAFLLGLIIISKIRHREDEISIEWIDVLKRLFRNYMAVLGVFVVVLLISLSICSQLTFDYSMAIDNNYATILLPPTLEYPFGTDNYGRCVFTRIVFGARISLIVGTVATIVPIIIGGVLGAVSGYYSGRTDNIIMRLLDVLYAVPGILLAIAIVAAFGANTMNLILALSIGAIPAYARTVRATVMSIANNEFVEAAKACGAKDHTIIFNHIIPNSLAPIIVRATLGIGGAVLSTSALSYLGLGVEPHIPEWGNILKVGSNYLETNPYLAVFPGLAIILIVLSFNYFGDGLRDALDPKLK